MAFRLDQSMIDAVEERIERDGITLSAFMRQAVRKALRDDPGLPLPVLKVIALRKATPDQTQVFANQLRAVLDVAFQQFCGSRTEPAIEGAGPAKSDWALLLSADFVGPGEERPGGDFAFVPDAVSAA